MKKTYRMNGVDCANCALKMETEIAKLDGVNSCSISFVMQKLTIDVDAEKLDSIIEKASAVCKRIDRHAEIIIK